MSIPITLVAGARPNFMKIAPILRAFRSYPAIRVELVHTGQHYSDDMSRVFFDELGIPAPDVHLGAGSGTHGRQTAHILEAFEDHLLQSPQQPRCVVVVGDVNSTFACTLAAVKLGIPVAHVEAGLRSFDRTMPEEINRLATDAIADLLFVSEPAGQQNLIREGVSPERIEYAGNVMIDTLVQQLPAALETDVSALVPEPGRDYAVITLHRPSNVDSEEHLKALVEFLGRLSRRLALVFPAHPRTRAMLEQFGLLDAIAAHRDIVLSGPLGYHENLRLMVGARVVVTDSGGIQEETTFLGVPCLTARENTERPVTITSGTNTLIGHDFDLAERLADEILAGRYKRSAPIPGWDGHAAERIARTLVNRYAGAQQDELALVETADRRG